MDRICNNFNCLAYQTVAHLLQGDLNGKQIGELDICAEDLDHNCWDYILKKGHYIEGCKVPEEKLSRLRHEFEYWYPSNIHFVNKFYIRNHINEILLNHATIW